MKTGRKPLLPAGGEWCTDYHCAGDCGLSGHGAQHAKQPPKTTAERVAALRLARDVLGLKRLELYAHPDDWPAIKTLAEKLQKRRARMAKQKAG